MLHVYLRIEGALHVVGVGIWILYTVVVVKWNTRPFTALAKAILSTRMYRDGGGGGCLPSLPGIPRRGEGEAVQAGRSESRGRSRERELVVGEQRGNR